MESLKDLLNPSNRLLQNNQMSKYEPTWVEVADETTIFDLLKKSEVNRAVAQTSCNEKSSRSHSIFQI
jgi:hypothetical protein